MQSFMVYAQELESQDYFNAIALVSMIKVIELVCILAIWRWKSNINKDVKQFKIQAKLLKAKKQNNSSTPLMTPDLESYNPVE